MSNNPLPQGKRIHVYRSGDASFEGANVNYNPMVFKRMDNFLDEIAEKVPIWGAVRSIHTPNTGTVVSELNSLGKNKGYVAAGPKGFISIPGGYENIGKHILLKRSEIRAHKVIKRLGHSSIDSKTIFVYRNGDATSRSRPFRVSNDETHWEKVLERMSEVIRLATGDIKKLYDFNGRIVDSIESLHDKQYYVAAGPGETFRSVSYAGSDKLKINSLLTGSVDDAGSSTPRSQMSRSFGHINIQSRKSKPYFFKKPRRRKSKNNLEDLKDGHKEDNEHENVDINEKKRSFTSSFRSRSRSLVAFKGSKTKPNRRKSRDDLSSKESISRLPLRKTSEPGMRRSKSVDSKESTELDEGRSNKSGRSQDDMNNTYETLNEIGKEDQSENGTEDDTEEEEEVKLHHHDTENEEQIKIEEEENHPEVDKEENDNKGTDEQGNHVAENEEHNHNEENEEHDPNLDEKEHHQHVDGVEHNHEAQDKEHGNKTEAAEHDHEAQDEHHNHAAEGKELNNKALDEEHDHEPKTEEHDHEALNGEQEIKTSEEEHGLIEKVKKHDYNTQNEEKKEQNHNTGSVLLMMKDSGHLGIFKAKVKHHDRDEEDDDEENEALDLYDDHDSDHQHDSGRGSLLSNDSDHGGIFKAKQKSRPSTTISVDYDTDSGGIFRAHSRSQYTRNAKTVLEDSKTKIEIPVDNMEANEVMEEVY